MTTIREFTYNGCLSKMLVFAGHPNLVFFFSFLNQEWVQHLAPASAPRCVSVPAWGCRSADGKVAIANLGLQIEQLRQKSRILGISPSLRACICTKSLIKNHTRVIAYHSNNRIQRSPIRGHKFIQIYPVIEIWTEVSFLTYLPLLVC